MDAANRDRHGSRHMCAVAAALLVGIVVAVPTATAGPEQPASDDQLIQPLPVVTPKPTNWKPKFPFPYSQTQNEVTDADVHAQGEMCQWYTAQFKALNDQIGRLQFNRISPDGTDWDYSVGDLPRQVDIVTTNIDQSVDFLAPRAQALTQKQDFAGDTYFPLYEGEAFYGLWQQLSNVSNGIKAHQPDWFTGPSYLRMKRLASEINRSHVCD
ncbi:hypothetical protein [Mycolicibacterium sp. lyk4-40-TYG-92]|uniref:hypothetical protein n=1 Tax=Mycolicibacterium sp. lyk4-40-TYG-92 TaxID=3040295 RepID=UPI00254B23AA|nr:hypothetical protein [Mycolicibacterium sp. lyk4-40-TYG-92]